MKKHLMQFVVCGAMVAALAGSVQAAQKPEATKGIGIHLKTSIEYGVDVYRWLYDRFHSGPSAWRSTAGRSEPQNKKAPVKPGELSE